MSSMAKHNKWPTPAAADHRDRGHMGTAVVQRRIRIGKQVGLSMAVSDKSGQLNPDWVELLMGWPKGWTSLEPMPQANWQSWLEADNDWPADWETGTPRTGKVANSAARLKAIGNGQVPAVVQLALTNLRERINNYYTTGERA